METQIARSCYQFLRRLLDGMVKHFIILLRVFIPLKERIKGNCVMLIKVVVRQVIGYTMEAQIARICWYQFLRRLFWWMVKHKLLSSECSYVLVIKQQIKFKHSFNTIKLRFTSIFRCDAHTLFRRTPVMLWMEWR